MSKEISASPVQDNRQLLRKRLLAMLLGILTAFFCLYVADGLYGIQGLKQTEYMGEIVGLPAYKKAVDVDNQTGGIIFWIFAIGLPILFSRWISWRDTFVNYWCYPIYWFIVNDMFESHPGHSFLDPGHVRGMLITIDFRILVFPFIWTLFIFLVHSAVFMCFKNLWKKSE